MFPKMYSWNKSATFSFDLKSPLFTWKNFCLGVNLATTATPVFSGKKKRRAGKTQRFFCTFFSWGAFSLLRKQQQKSQLKTPQLVKVHDLYLLPEPMASMTSWCYSDPYNERSFGGEKIWWIPHLPSPTYHGTHGTDVCLGPACADKLLLTSQNAGVKGVPFFM